LKNKSFKGSLLVLPLKDLIRFMIEKIKKLAWPLFAPIAFYALDY